MYFFINGSFQEGKNASIPILDLGLLRGQAIFDYLRTYSQKPFHLLEHLARLRYSAKESGLTLPYSDEEIEEVVKTLIEKNSPQECSLKLILTGGVSEDQMTPADSSTFIAFAYPLNPINQIFYREGVSVITTKQNRILPTCKTTSYLPASLALREGRKQGAIEALYLSEKKDILEGTTSNFFAFRDGILITPPGEGILLGITRAVVLEICKDLFPIEERPIPFSEIPLLDEAFLTASNKEVMPICQIDKTLIKAPGPNTLKVMRAFRDYTENPSHPPLSIDRYKPSLLASISRQINDRPVECTRSV